MLEILYALSLIAAIIVGFAVFMMAVIVIASWFYELMVRKDNIDYERLRYRLRYTFRLPGRYPRPIPLLIRFIQIAIVAIGVAWFVWVGNTLNWDFGSSSGSNNPYFDSPDPE